MRDVRVALLGRFEARRGDEPIEGLESKKAQELLAYLLLHRRRAHHREALSEVLWPESLPRQARRYLRQALWQLNVALEPFRESSHDDAVAAPPGEWLRIRLGSSSWLDVADLEQASIRTESAAANGSGSVSWPDVERACRLYKGDLLEGRNEDWIVVERQRIKDIYFRTVQSLMDHYIATGEPAIGCRVGIRSLRHDRAREPVHRALMKLHCLTGDRVAALRQYQCCRRVLQREFGALPEPETEALRRKIRSGASFECRGQTESQPDAERVQASPAVDDRPLTLSALRQKVRDLEGHLDQLRSELQSLTLPSGSSGSD